MPVTNIGHILLLHLFHSGFFRNQEHNQRGICCQGNLARMSHCCDAQTLNMRLWKKKLKSIDVITLLGESEKTKETFHN